MIGTRRLAAILAADVAGYSRLIGADEEGTLFRLRSIRAKVIDPIIAEHRGRLVKTTGDGLLVEFGSVVDALRCAIEVQQGMAVRNSGIALAQRSSSESASTWAMSLSRTAIFSATGSMSPPDLKHWLIPVASASRRVSKRMLP